MDSSKSPEEFGTANTLQVLRLAGFTRLKSSEPPSPKQMEEELPEHAVREISMLDCFEWHYEDYLLDCESLYSSYCLNLFNV